MTTEGDPQMTTDAERAARTQDTVLFVLAAATVKAVARNWIFVFIAVVAGGRLARQARRTVALRMAAARRKTAGNLAAWLRS